MSGSWLSILAPYRRGDWVVYRRTKFSTHPGPRARNVAPAQNGDEYSYTIDKFWIVADVLPDRSLVLITRRGKSHVVRPGDPNLRKAHLLEHWNFRERFAEIAAQGVRSTQPRTRTA